MKTTMSTLADICTSLYTIIINEHFEKMSETDQRLIIEVYGRLQRRLNKAGISAPEAA